MTLLTTTGGHQHGHTTTTQRSGGRAVYGVLVAGRRFGSQVVRHPDAACTIVLVDATLWIGSSQRRGQV